MKGKSKKFAAQCKVKCDIKIADDDNVESFSAPLTSRPEASRGPVR